MKTLLIVGLGVLVAYWVLKQTQVIPTQPTQFFPSVGLTIGGNTFPGSIGFSVYARPGAPGLVQPVLYSGYPGGAL